MLSLLLSISTFSPAGHTIDNIFCYESRQVREGTHIFYQFVNKGLQVVSELCSQHDSNLTETLPGNLTATIWNAGAPRLELCFYLGPQNIKHSLH